MQKMALIVTVMDGHLLFTSMNEARKKQYDGCYILLNDQGKYTDDILLDIICWTLLFSRLTEPLLQIFWGKFFKCKAISELRNGWSKPNLA